MKILLLIVVSMFIGVSAHSETDRIFLSGQNQEVLMNSLNIDLQDGFNNDLVMVRIDGKEIFHKDGVQTKLLLGCAESFSAQISGRQVKIEVFVPSKNLSKAIILQISKPVYLGISIQEGGIQYRVAYEPFGYM